MRNTLICTVGTSLFEANLRQLSEKTADAPENWSDIRQAYDASSWRKLAQELLRVDPMRRLCGAEINTIQEVKGKNWLSLENLIFLVSDTHNGKNTGEVLQHYFSNRRDLSLRTVDYRIVDQLQDERPKDFKVYGLRNLVRNIGDYIQRFGGPDFVAIDATGGYKAQIAIAVIIGQALNIPVFYKHERFSEIIDFPPLPISFDHTILAQYSDLLTDFERGKAFSSSEFGHIDEKLRVLLSEVIVDGESVYELSPIGQIYLTGFRLRNPKPINLIAAENRRPPTFRDDHYPVGFKDFVEKVWCEVPWLKTTNSLPYDKQKNIKGIGFYVREEEGTQKLVGTFQDKNKFGARFCLHVTDESANALTWAADFLNQRYRTDQADL
ncbi:MAG: putative CRISPR-associated protein [Candidatus Competibacter sp.]|nr:putative CRISPR-associated protein [Candidatus Competibacteraceae bacterium]